MAQRPQRKGGSGSGGVNGKPGGWDDPDALAAFYARRSESLRDSNTVQRQTQQTMQKKQDDPYRPTQGILEYVISALQGNPGKVRK